MNKFHDLFILYGKDIYRFALFLCGDKTEAEEITAETFSRALTGKAPISSATVKGYLLTIARNLYIDSVRNKNRVLELSSELPDLTQQLEHEISQKTELEAVQTYLQTFPEEDRAALLLRADGLSYDEIANSLNISLSSAKVKVHRLRMKLFEWRTSRE